ncbi:MAG TPA: DUF368 domain-containing protein [Porticoccaceae bacterium]|nr:DUF368 domain-containing protein [Porticoccaceae bacterium]HCO60353.1 DUF368 domain-containing protein [Porticoccaceae bacterium]
MGAADVVPGVSGGTIAFISGIYERLLAAIGSFDLTAARLLLERRFKAFWQHIDGGFLLVLFSGILLSIATFARLLTYMLAHHPLLVWGFFFGLIGASIIFIWRQIKTRGLICWLLLFAGAALVVASAFTPQTQLLSEQGPQPLYIFASGMLAICAMILPGVSGSFILLLLGVYPVILEAVVEVRLAVLMTFAAGCLVGLLSFSRLLSWLLRNYHSATLATLTGFLAGSLAVVWPWRQLVQSEASGSGGAARLQLYLPADYAQAVGDSRCLAVLGVMVLGLTLVLMLEYLSGGVRRERL